MKILIQNGRVLDPARGFDAQADVAIDAGRILAIGNVPTDFAPAQVINAAGCIVAPGLVDLAARLREPGYEHEGMLESEMAEAVAGGVTSLVCLIKKSTKQPIAFFRSPLSWTFYPPHNLQISQRHPGHRQRVKHWQDSVVSSSLPARSHTRHLPPTHRSRSQAAVLTIDAHALRTFDHLDLCFCHLIRLWNLVGL